MRRAGGREEGWSMKKRRRRTCRHAKQGGGEGETKS